MIDVDIDIENTIGHEDEAIASLTILSLFCNSKFHYLKSNKFTICDSIFFARYVYITKNKYACNLNTAYLDAYLAYGLEQIYKISHHDSLYCFKNRSYFYDRLFYKKSLPLNNIIEEFKLLITHDIVTDNFVEFDFDSPVMITEFVKMIAIKNEATLLTNKIIKAKKTTATDIALFNKKKEKKKIIAIIITTLIAIALICLLPALTKIIPAPQEETETDTYITTSEPQEEFDAYNTDWETTTETTTREPLPLPKSGDIIIPTNKSRDSQITIKNSSTHCFVKLKDENGNDEFGFFVRGGETVTVDVPRNNYYVYFASGYNWYGKNNDELFGEDTVCSRDDEIQDFYNYTCTYTLEEVSYGNFRPQGIDQEDF